MSIISCRRRGLICMVFSVLAASLTQLAWADTVCISDLTEGQPTVTVYTGGVVSSAACNTGGTDVTTSRVTVLPDSGPDFLHFNLAGAPPAGKFGADLWEDQVGGTLSDVLLYGANATGLAGIDVSFCSDPIFCNPAGYNILSGGLLEPIENGLYQYEGGVGNTGLGSGGYNFYIQSDVEPTVPEPNPVWLLLGASGAIGMLRRRQK